MATQKFTLKQTAQEVQDALDNVYGLDEFANQLGNKRQDGKWITEYKTINEDALSSMGSGVHFSIYNITNESGKQYSTAKASTYGTASTFSGWMGYIGKPSKISWVKVPGMLAASTNPDAGDAPNKVRITIYRVPKWEEVEGVWDKRIPAEEWNKYQLLREEHELSQPLTHSWEWQIIQLNTPFVNTNDDMLMLCYEYNAICSACILVINEAEGSDPETNKSSYPCGYNPFTYYTTAQKTVGGFSDYLSALYTSVADVNTTSLYVVPVMVGYLDSTSTFYDVNTKEGGNFFNKVSEVLANKNIQGTVDAEIMLPESYDLVVGDKFQLFFRSIIKCYGDYQRFGINCICSKGTFYPDYFEYTPTADDSASYTLTIVLRDLTGKYLTQKQTKLNIHKVPTFGSATTKNLCVFGDSLTSSGTWAAEGIRRLVGTSDSGFSGPASLKIPNLTINTYGHKTNTINTQVIKHEGYGGWTWKSFITDYGSTDSTTNGLIVTLNTNHSYEIDTVQKSIWTDNNGLKWELEDLPADNKIKFNRGAGNNQAASTITLPTSMTCTSPSLSITIISSEWESGNPFWNENTNKVDFKNWATEVGCPAIDIAACLLTWNAGGASGNESGYSYQSSITAHINDAKTLLTQFHTDYPNAKIICMGIQIPSLTGGSGANYGSNGSYADMWGTAFYAWDYNKALEELCLSDDYKDFCYYVDTKGQFDTIHNMPSKTEKVNTRSDITYTLGTNGVHPATEGYYQIGDAFFRKLVAVLNN